MKLTPKRIKLQQFDRELQAAGINLVWTVASEPSTTEGVPPPNPDMVESFQFILDGAFVEPIGSLRDRIAAVWSAHVPQDTEDDTTVDYRAIIRALLQSQSLDTATKQAIRAAITRRTA